MIEMSFERALNELADLISVESEEMSRFYVAIDGLSGSGKSTLAARLSEALGAPIVCMDDFYLPLSERKGERIKDPGWNVDYERFTREVAKNALMKRPISYGVFDCSSQSIRKTITLPESRYLIVEGCYAMHPEIPDFYDLRIVVTADRALCESRIRARDGDAMLKRFQNEWFPLEQTYLDAYMLRELSDVVVFSDGSLPSSESDGDFRGFEMEFPLGEIT